MIYIVHMLYGIILLTNDIMIYYTNNLTQYMDIDVF